MKTSASFEMGEKSPMQDVNLLTSTESSPISWAERSLRPMGAGSERGTVLTLVTSAVGAGCLAVPHAFIVSGMMGGVLWIFVAGALLILSGETLLQVNHLFRGIWMGVGVLRRPSALPVMILLRLP